MKYACPKTLIVGWLAFKPSSGSRKKLTFSLKISGQNLFIPDLNPNPEPKGSTFYCLSFEKNEKSTELILNHSITMFVIESNASRCNIVTAWKSGRISLFPMAQVSVAACHAIHSEKFAI